MKELNEEERHIIQQLELRIEWIKNPFPVQRYNDETGNWVDCFDPAWLEIINYRRKPTKSPLSMNDIDLLNDTFAYKTLKGDELFVAIHKSKKGVRFHHGFVTYEKLMECYLRSTHDEDAFDECSKETITKTESEL